MKAMEADAQKLAYCERDETNMAPSNIILDDKILEAIICSYCKRCLTVGETKIYQFGDISCGRCRPEDNNKVGCISLYERVAPYLQFPCSNHHTGCTELLPYNGVEAHEKICTKVASCCPICPGTSKYAVTELQRHFEVVHPRNVMNSNQFSLNINCLDKTEEHLLFRKPFLLLFVKFDGQWLYVNVSVPYEQVLNKYKQKVTNSKQSKPCKFLGKNDDCFKFYLPRSLDCIAKIQLNRRNIYDLYKYCYSLTPIGKGIFDTNVVKISISFVPNEMKKGTVPNMKTEWEPVYLPKLCIGDDTKEYFVARYGAVDVESFRFSPCGQRIINVRDATISIQVKCQCCENFFWESPFKCQHFTICYQCCIAGYKKCEYLDELQRDNSLADLVKLRFHCRYNCESIFKMDQLVDHENTCEFNLLRSLSDIEYGKLCFGSIFKKNSKLVWANGLNLFSFSNNSDIDRIFLITKDDRKCVFQLNTSGNKNFFSLEHEYDKTKYAGIIRILCKDGKVREEENSFFANDSNISNGYFITNKRIVKDDDLILDLPQPDLRKIVCCVIFKEY